VQSNSQPFELKDCALIALATGRRAMTLRELRDGLETIDPGSIYYHFWGGLLRPRFDDPEYNNDFASWARHALHDWVLAERLSVIDPSVIEGMEALRQELIEVIEERLDEREVVPWSRPDQQFHFLTSQIVVFDTHRRLAAPQELLAALPTMSRGSVFYHFIDARRRHPERLDDFRAWLTGRDEDHTLLCRQLSDLDPFFTSLVETRDHLLALFREAFGEEIS
jgi:hypothetical protein